MKRSSKEFFGAKHSQNSFTAPLAENAENESNKKKEILKGGLPQRILCALGGELLYSLKIRQGMPRRFVEPMAGS
jgi:hypothetical protein